MYPLGRLSSQTWRFSSFWEHQFTDGSFLTGKIPAKNDLHAGGMTDLFRHESMVICVKLIATSRKQPHFKDVCRSLPVAVTTGVLPQGTVDESTLVQGKSKLMKSQFNQIFALLCWKKQFRFTRVHPLLTDFIDSRKTRRNYIYNWGKYRRIHSPDLVIHWICNRSHLFTARSPGSQVCRRDVGAGLSQLGNLIFGGWRENNQFGNLHDQCDLYNGCQKIRTSCPDHGVFS